ncbi:MAG: SDR family NAD(P)-dependent oxidoreductase [Burkholderiaceae bacterium]|nr:SDR family NAD(P)-dependent oxidoreductase [Burkholderiaceae bacterium]
MIPRPHYRSLPRRFRRATVLIVGCGDVGTRAARQLLARHRPDRLRVVGTTRGAEAAARLREIGVLALRVDLDEWRAANGARAKRLPGLQRIRALAHWMIDLAPPPNRGAQDRRTQRLLAALGRGGRGAAREFSGPPASRWRATPLRYGGRGTRRWVYVSTTGVYGDTGGARFDESRPVAPASARAVRRVDAERRLRMATRRGQARATIVRAPGIYAQDRLPIERLRKALPALAADEDVWTNHIHAADLATTTLAALFRGRANRVVHAVDDSALKMGDYFDRVADALGLQRPPRVARRDLAALVTPMMLSFMSESRLLTNLRLKAELRVRLAYPQVDDTLAAAGLEHPEPML